MRSNLFIKVFVCFWLVTVAVLGSWTLALRYFDDLPAVNTRPEGTPPRYMLHLFYALENAPQRELAHIVRRAQREKDVDIFLLDRAGQDILGQSVPPQAQRVAAKMSGERRRASARTEQGHFVGQVLNRNREQPLRAVVRLTPPRPLVAALGSSPLLRLGLAVLISGLLCFLLSRVLTRRLRLVQEATRKLADGALDTRIPVSSRGGDETAELARDFNTMATELQSRVEGQKRLLQDVSHELRSPLARLRIALALAQEQPAQCDSHLQRIEREAERLDELITQLLSSQADAIELDTHIDLVSLLGALARDADFEAHPGNKHVVFVSDLQEALVPSAGDLLLKCFENILRNAVKYTAADTEVSVNLRATDDGYRICIEDRGPGVPEAELDRIFDPLYRVDTERTRASGGYGLGLAIARRAIEQHGGRLQAQNTGTGLRVTAMLPADSG